MADRIVVMRDGRIHQVDTPQQLYDHPVDMFVAGFIGAPQMNFFPVTLEANGDGYSARFDGNSLPLPPRLSGDTIAANVGREVILGLRPEAFSEGPPPDVDPALTAPIEAEVDLAEPMGAEVHLNVAISSTDAIARVSPRCTAQAGDKITLTADLTMAHLFDPETEASLLRGAS